MSKLFISLPMKGRSDEQVKARMLDIFDRACNKLNTEYELIATFNDEEEPSDVVNHCWYLGESIKLLATADLVIFDADWYKANGCRMEKWVCDNYDIPYYILSSDSL